ncbi:MAG TPA: chemotaxis-specific protein-glutamate methyltransferase CheB [Oligoflexus sp.]|uniref:chemotaxis-specific protein-glutamate methyltransferase CheB n=1 Tax=Oligoflexus sp. TaxID=1971216 RepID=UPI002D44AB31|nr:chemotaxis-specific protein-glutamate methyltransferase CheB [Oligoflexus sp.]HYX33154.1 chemotaxis-specific protein-glutamate methyltransferase CheB [Oligoflexus sp.]
MHKPIRVLIVDDSAFVRETLTQALAQTSSIEVVGTAADPYEARDLLLKLKPDVMTLDMEMPRMNGTEFLRRLLPQWPIPVIMLSSYTARGTTQAMDALSAGAVEVVFKPLHFSQAGFQDMMIELVQKINFASQAQVQDPAQMLVEKNAGTPPGKLAYLSSRFRLIAIGSSTGGPQALTLILRNLPSDLPAIVIAQHLPAGFSHFFAARLQQETPVVTREAIDGETIQKSIIYIAPSGMQTEVLAMGPNLVFRVFKSAEPMPYNPCIDVLFHSIAKSVGKKSIGVLLTGMGHDGAKGLKSMLEAGAPTIGQDERSSVVYGMSAVAKQLGAVDRELPLTIIPGEILRVLRGVA